MNKNESLSQDRSFSSYPTSSSNINIQFISSIQGSSPQYRSSSLRNYVENPPFDGSSPSGLDGCHLFEESQSIVELHYLIWRAIRCRLNDYFLTIYLQCCVRRVDCEQPSCVKIISIRYFLSSSIILFMEIHSVQNFT